MLQFVFLLTVCSCLFSVGCANISGRTWHVSTFDKLHEAVEACSSGDRIVVAPGQYHVTKPLYLTKANVVVRGSVGEPDKVVLHGNGMNEDTGVTIGFWTAADGIELRDFTIQGFWKYGVVLSGREPAGALPDRLVLSNLRIQDCGARHIKGVYSKDYSEGVLIEKVHCFQTQNRQRRPGHPVDENNYIGGIDCMKTKDWIIRDCRFENILGVTGGGRGAIFMWIDSVNPLIERNVIVNCGAAVCLGNGHNPEGVYHVTGGVVRNNFIYHAGHWRAVELGYTRGVKFVHNTLYGKSDRIEAIDIYDRTSIATSRLEIRNNIIRGDVRNRAKGEVVMTGNLIGAVAKPDWFVDPPSGRLGLTEAAGEAIDRVQPLPEVPHDIQGHPRPIGALADVGAHERP